MKAPVVLCLVLLTATAALAQQPDLQRTPTDAAQPNAAAGATAPSPALVDPREAHRLFSRFDTDRDGRLSEAELDATRADQGNWLAIDRDRDGRITRDEFTASAASKVGAAAPGRRRQGCARAFSRALRRASS